MAKRGWREKSWFSGGRAKAQRGLDTVGPFNKMPCRGDTIRNPRLGTAQCGRSSLSLRTGKKLVGICSTTSCLYEKLFSVA